MNIGNMPNEHQGIKSSVADVYRAIKEGMSDTEIMELYPEQSFNLDRFERIRQRIKAEENAQIRREMTVYYIWGDTGVGKTRYCLEKHGYENVYRVTDYKHPFDLYQSQDYLCLDEFSSSIDIYTMNNILDRISNAS